MNTDRHRCEGGQDGLRAVREIHGVVECGFSLIEILVTIGLLSFIVLGLLAMFNQTQRAFMSSMKQTDVLESGRLTMDMLSRELAQTTPCLFPDVYRNGVRIRATN